MKTYDHVAMKVYRVARRELLMGLAGCTEKDRAFFRRMYAHGNLALTTAEVIARMPTSSLSAAMEQVETILKKKLKSTQETYTVISVIDLQDFIFQTYKLVLNIRASERWEIGESTHRYNITGTLYPSEVRTLDELCAGALASYDVCRIVLEKLSIDGHITPGEYLIKVGW